MLASYDLGPVLGEGGMGRVVRARHRALGVDVAIKELSAPTPELIELLRDEARILFTLKHPAFPAVRDFFSDGGRFFLVMDLVPGMALSTLVAQHGPLTPAALDTLARGALAALAHLHAARIVHRDLKPANIICEGDRVVLVDFGIARASALTPRTMMWARNALTPCFAPPEQYRGEPSSPAADLYALGATLHCAASARVPPEAPRRECGGIDPMLELGGLRPDLPLALTSAVTRCLALDPAARPTAAALLAELGGPAAGAAAGAGAGAAAAAAMPTPQALDTYAKQRRLDIRRAPR